MKKLIFSIVALCACAGAASAAETVLLYETFASGQGAFTIENVNLPSSTDYVWNFSDSYMKASAYIGGTPYAADSWLISPTFDLPRSYRSATLTFDHAAKFQNGTVSEEFQVYYAISPSATFDASEWTNVTIPTYPTAGSWTYVSSGEISLPFNATKIAFRYKSTRAAADIWNVKNVKIVADEYDEGEAFYVYNSDGTTITHGIAKVDSILFVKPVTVTIAGYENGYGYVDLGLSVKWATCNVGATKPEEYGNYYAWGETATKSDYSWDTYKYGSSSDALTKYCNDSSRGKDGFTDDLTTLEAADDAAAVNWGDAWRMPTDAEWQELIDNCDWIWTDDYNDTGVAGCIVASKTNGNAIFLPAAGDRDGGRLLRAGYSGGYWSSSLDLNSPDYARTASFYSDGVGRGSGAHRYGKSVRAVHK